MKKTTLLALLSAAALFFSCTNPSSDSSSNNTKKTDKEDLYTYTPPKLPASDPSDPFKGNGYKDQDTAYLFGVIGNDNIITVKTSDGYGNFEDSRQYKYSYYKKDGIEFMTVCLYKDKLSQGLQTFEEIAEFYKITGGKLQII